MLEDDSVESSSYVIHPYLKKKKNADESQKLYFKLLELSKANFQNESFKNMPKLPSNLNVHARNLG